jgi:hypothetical protein
MPDLILGPNDEALRHGAGVAAQVVGKSVGICPSCTLVMVKNQYPNTKVFGWLSFSYEELLSHFQNVLDDIRKKERQGKSAVVMSWALVAKAIPPAFLAKLRK